jgi:hypothetical protein
MSCLFNSLSYFLNDIDSTKLRMKICEYLETNPTLFDNIKSIDIIKWENGMDKNTYINNMKKTTTWGGGIEIKCFCNIYNMSVIVNHKNKKIEFLPDNKDFVKKIEIYYTGNHYEPVK